MFCVWILVSDAETVVEVVKELGSFPNGPGFGTAHPAGFVVMISVPQPFDQVP